MIDLSRVLSLASEVLGSAGNGGAASGGMLADLLAERGLDPSGLEGLGQEQIMSFLAEQGVDLAGLDPQQVLEQLQSYGLEDAASLLGGSEHGGEPR